MCDRCLYHPMSQVGSLLVVESSPLPAPQRPVLQSLLPLEPIEDPASWAWGLHPDNGLDYKAKDNLEVEVCLKNPAMINTAKCKLPLDVCLANPRYIAQIGCAGQRDSLPPLPQGKLSWLLLLQSSSTRRTA